MSLPRPVANGTLVAQADSLCYAPRVNSDLIHPYLTLDPKERRCKRQLSNKTRASAMGKRALAIVKIRDIVE